MIIKGGTPHVYGDDSISQIFFFCICLVLPMYMGMIPPNEVRSELGKGTPHVYGDDSKGSR